MPVVSWNLVLKNGGWIKGQGPVGYLIAPSIVAGGRTFKAEPAIDIEVLSPHAFSCNIVPDSALIFELGIHSRMTHPSGGNLDSYLPKLDIITKFNLEPSLLSKAIFPDIVKQLFPTRFELVVDLLTLNSHLLYIILTVVKQASICVSLSVEISPVP